MLALLGIKYFADSIIAAMHEQAQDEAYRIYHTECLYAICASLGNPLEKTFYDIMHPEAEDTRSGDEIAEERLKRFGIEVVD